MNRDLLSKIGLFITGVAVGSAVTWKLVKTKYEKIAQEEIDSVRETFSKHASESDENEKTVETEEEEPDQDIDKKIYQHLVDETGYAAKSTEKEDKKDMSDTNKPYVIAPDEFGECDYAMLTLTCYTDGTVTNERGKIVTNVDELVGNDSLECFGENEDDPDSVYVRNDKLQIDYEILKDYRDYSEID